METETCEEYEMFMDGKPVKIATDSIFEDDDIKVYNYTEFQNIKNLHSNLKCSFDVKISHVDMRAIRRLLKKPRTPRKLKKRIKKYIQEIN